MPATLKDVAALAGVSIKTASNVVNDRPHIRPATRERVEQAIATLGYRPNLMARQLKNGRAGFLALAIPQVDWPYFAELAERFTHAAAKAGYILLLEATRAEAEAERALLSGAGPHQVAGLVFSPLSLTADEIAQRTDPTPLVLLGERAVPPGVDHVALDSVAAARAMTEHLLGLGRRRIAVIGYRSERGTSSVRMEGYLAALRAAGVERRPEYEIDVRAYERQEGLDAMRRLLELPEPPDAVFCFNDLMAIGALRACREAGVRVPEDVAVAGFDDIAEAEFCNPALTSVSPDMDHLTTETVRLLVGRIEGTREGSERVDVPWRIVVRASTQAE